MKKRFFLPFCLLACLAGKAQLTTETTWKPAEAGTSEGVEDFMLSFQVGVPSHDMRPAIRNRMGNVGFGGGLLVLSDPYTWGRNKRESALRIGGSLGYTYYGRFRSDVNINSYYGDYKTSYGILDLKAIVRFRPDLGRRIQPFADIQAGGDFYLSSIKENLGVIESALGIEETDLGGTSSASFSKGIGAGMAIGKPNSRRAKLLLRATYNWGSPLKYIVRNSVAYNTNTGSLSYQTDRAPVRYLLVQVGIGL